MPVETLRFAPWHTKKHLSQSKYEALTAAVAKVLCYTITIPDGQLDVVWVRAFVRAYLQDNAQHALQVLDMDEDDDGAPLTPDESTIRRSTLVLAGRLAKIQDGLDVAMLADLAVAYGAQNAATLRAAVADACSSTPALIETLATDVVPAFVATLGGSGGTSTDAQDVRRVRRAARVLVRLVRCGVAAVVVPFAQDGGEFVRALARCYRGAGGAKADLVDSFHAIVQTLLASGHADDTERLFGLLFALLELTPAQGADRTPFVSRPLLVDYQYAFNLSGRLSDAFRGADDARVDLLVATLAGLSPSPEGAKPAGGLAPLIKGRAPRKYTPAAGAKGKAKAENQGSDKDGRLDLAISQVLDIFPSHTPQYIRRCLEHTIFDGDPEKLISALLEGTIPPELDDNGDAHRERPPQTDDFVFTKDRHNLWDEDIMDVSRLRIGKLPEDADAFLQDRSFMERMKADIIRRAEELSDEENDATDKPRDINLAFEEDLEGSETLIDKSVKVAGDGEASDETDGEDEPGEVGGSVETILELAYLDDPRLFDRDAVTRRSKARAELKKKTGWGDEQIEGWKIMLERNPRKDAILRKHEFAGNAPLAIAADSPTGRAEPGPGGSSQPGRGSGRGGRGRGAAGGQGNNDTARERALKDKNKARSANHNRKRGHDRKVARGGGPPA